MRITEIARSRDLRYAVAEVILVVVGILIALAVDSWWSKRSELIRTEELLTALEFEWSSELERLDARIDEYKYSKDGMIGIINAHVDDQSSLTDEEAIRLIEAARFVTFKPTVAALNVLLAEGLQNIGDSNLETAIAKWPTMLDEVRPEQEALHDIMFFHIRKARANVAHKLGYPYDIAGREIPNMSSEIEPLARREMPDYWYGLEPSEFAHSAIADDEFVAVIRHAVDIADLYRAQLIDVRGSLSESLALLRNRQPVAR